MKKNIVYWSPCLNPVGTLKSTINSAKGLSKYSNKEEYSVSLINVCGEWNDYKNDLKANKIDIIDLTFSYFNFLPKHGYFNSRFSYIVIILFSFFPLLKFLFKTKPDFFIAHLITSLPIIIFNLFNLKTKLILRISGFPKLNFIRKLFWQKSANNISHVTCPSRQLMKKLAEIEIFNISKMSFLPDAIISYKDFKNDKSNEVVLSVFNTKKKIMLAAGRLTKQKNFSFLINEFSQFSRINKDYILVILGEGEERKKLNKLILKNKMNNEIFIPGKVTRIYKYMRKSDVFILSSLWEEIGFVIVEAALSNLFVISSDCPNGPSEFLSEGRGGILFKNNRMNALSDALKRYCNLKEKNKYLFISKKNSLQYTKYRHFLKLKDVLTNFKMSIK
jgi:glycosyltransferase involved in cell wall biosynthesis